MSHTPKPKRKRVQKRTPEGWARERERKRRWRQAHRAECRAAFLRWEKSSRGRAYFAKWRAAHPDYFREYHRRRREQLGLPPPKPRVARTPEERREWKRKWSKRNPEKSREAARRYYAKIMDSYELHDAVCLRKAMWARRRGLVDPAKPYVPLRGRRIPPSWMRRFCDTYAPGAQGAAGEAYARELAVERRQWLHSRNII